MQEPLKFKKVFLFLMGLSLSPSVYAAPPEQYDYPELSVAPRASDRIHSEAARESGTWYYYLPIQLSSLTTLAAGVASYNSIDPSGAFVGMGVGAGWLITSIVMAAAYHPYRSADAQISTMPKTSMRDNLTRERAAEEELRSAASVGQRLKWLSFLSNLGASAFIISRNMAASGGAVPYTVQPVAVGLEFASAALSLAPLVFKFHWGDVCDEQMEYKKRIYSPVAHAIWTQDPSSQNYAPGLGVSLAF